MCTEFLLSLFYFLTISITNFFLIQNAKKSFQQILYCFRTLFILKNVKINPKKDVFLSLIKLKKNKNPFDKKKKIKEFKQDILILGTFFMFSRKNLDSILDQQYNSLKKSIKNPIFCKKIFFNLLNKQWLDSVFF
jgi:hypothetical protein